MSETASLVLLVGFLLSATGVRASCPIELSPPSVVVRYGDSVSVNCSTSASLFEGMGWEATEGGISLDKVNHLVWIVPSLTEWTISPFCYINPASESQFEQCSQKPKVVLYTFPDNISIRSNSSAGGVMKEGEEYQFTCDVHNIAPVQNLTVRWYRGDALVKTDTVDNPSKKPENHTSVFSFTPTRQDEGATFRCEAHLDLRPEGPQLNASSQDYNITVYFGPDVQCSPDVPDKLELLEGKTLESQCNVTGNPSPEVKWLKDGQPTNSSVALSRNDAGRYTVKADGAKLTVKTLWVLILYGPEFNCPSTYTALEDALHNFTCTAAGYPQPEITWSKDGEEKRVPDNLKRSDAGQYLITASSKLSSVNLTVEINVIFGPDIQCSPGEPDKLELLEGKTLESQCNVTGNPSPEVKWLKDGQPTNSSVALSRNDAGRYTVKADGAKLTVKTLWVLILYGPELKCPSTYTALEDALHNFTCTVAGYPQPEITWSKDGEEKRVPDNLKRSDAGQYLITASSKLSSVNLTVEINVIYPPSQIVELEDSEVDVGSTVGLKCASTGNPRPQYVWSYYQTDNVIEETDDGVSRLHIHNATAYNMGSYTCNAWNDAGNVSKTVRVTVKGARGECPIYITPDRMVIQYQSRGQLSATCKPTSTDSSHVKEIYWQDRQGVRVNSTSWFPDTDKDWDPRPVCTATFYVIEPCSKHLNFTLYKTPDSVSIHLDNGSSVWEERTFQLRCDITNVAPAENLVVRWYRGNETFEPLIKDSLRVTGCPPDNGTDCDISDVRSPLSVSSTISVTLNRTQNGTEFRCGAQLDLGREGPQPPPDMMSVPLKISVFYKPMINTTKLPKKVPVFKGYPEELVCEADGHPPPEIKWVYSSDKPPHVSGDNLIVSEAGVYNCSATNEVDSMSHEVVVILKEDYLPLLAGFVAVTVVAISIVFVFIYSIYYKNTKMRRYSLKNPKLDTPSGNVAQNGWDMQFPMTKLS